MTLKKLRKIEKLLQERGYKKYNHFLVSDESWAWFKSFDRTEDENGNDKGGYQVAFRVWDWSGYKFTPHYDEEVTLNFWASPSDTDGRYDFSANWEPIADIPTFEAMAKHFYEMIKIYISKPYDNDRPTTIYPR